MEVSFFPSYFEHETMSSFSGMSQSPQDEAPQQPLPRPITSFCSAISVAGRPSHYDASHGRHPRLLIQDIEARIHRGCRMEERWGFTTLSSSFNVMWWTLHLLVPISMLDKLQGEPTRQALVSFLSAVQNVRELADICMCTPTTYLEPCFPPPPLFPFSLPNPTQ